MKPLLIFLLVVGCCKPTPLDAQPQPSAAKVVYTTYVGPGSHAQFKALAVDPAGFAYVGGSGQLSDQSGCAFVTKLNQAGTSAVWSVCLPFTEVDGLAVDRNGFVFIAGLNGYPTMAVGGTQRSSTIWKLTPDARQIVYSTQIDGASDCTLFLDPWGSLYVGGTAGVTFQSTPGAFSTAPSDGGFVIKLDPSGKPTYATRLDVTSVYGIAANSRGEVWAAGWKCSVYCDGSHPSGYAAAIRALDAAGGTLLTSLTFGGPANELPGPFQAGLHDLASGVAIDANDAVWVVGGTESASVPTTPDALLGQRPKFAVAGYALKLSAVGDVVYGTYIATQQTIQSVAVDAGGSPYFTVFKAPTASLTALSADGASITVSTVSGNLVGAIGLDGNGGIFVAGKPTTLCNTTPGAYQPTSLQGIVCAGRFDVNQTGDAQVLYPLNAASLQPKAVAPGEVVILPAVNFTARPSLSFDGIRAPYLGADSSMILAIVPFGINTDWTTMSLDGVGGFVLPVQPAVPALFTVDGSGAGQADCLNSDGTPNSPYSPAKVGTVVSVFLTGAGAMDPPIVDGGIGPTAPPYPKPVQNLYVSVNGVPASINFVAQAPGRVAGIVRLDFQIPATTLPGDAVVQIGAGSDPSVFLWQPRTTIAVR